MSRLSPIVYVTLFLGCLPLFQGSFVYAGNKKSPFSKNSPFNVESQLQEVPGLSKAPKEPKRRNEGTVYQIIADYAFPTLNDNLERARSQQVHDEASAGWCGSLIDENHIAWVNDNGVGPVQDFGAFQISHAWTQGLRLEMEDAVSIPKTATAPPSLASKGIYTFAVIGLFDGHGGNQVAQTAAHVIPKTIEDFLSRLTAPQLLDSEVVRHTLENAFDETGARRPGVPRANGTTLLSVNQRLQRTAMVSGSTAVVAVILNRSLYLINLGDSRAVLIAQDGSGVRLTRDQKPEDLEETYAIRERGGEVKFEYGAARINGDLSVARALGDWAHPVGRKPEVTRIDLNQARPQGLILECDGVYNGVKNDHQAAEIGTNGAVNDAAKNLVLKALVCGSTDNISAVVVKFRHPTTSIK